MRPWSLSIQMLDPDAHGFEGHASPVFIWGPLWLSLTERRNILSSSSLAEMKIMKPRGIKVQIIHVYEKEKRQRNGFMCSRVQMFSPGENKRDLSDLQEGSKTCDLAEIFPYISYGQEVLA